MCKFLQLLAFFVFTAVNIYSQSGINCIGITGVHDFPAKVTKIDNDTYLVLIRDYDNIYLSKIENDEELWKQTYVKGSAQNLSVEVMGDKILVVGTVDDYFTQDPDNPFLLILSNEGLLLNDIEFMADDNFWSNAPEILVEDTVAYIAYHRKLLKVYEDGTLEVVYEGENICSFKKTSNSEWLAFVHGGDRRLMRLNQDFEQIAIYDLGAYTDYFDTNRIYFDSQDRIHILGLDHWDFNNPPIWKIATYDDTGNLLWIKKIAAEGMKSVFLGSIKEYNGGYVIFGMSQKENENIGRIPTLYFLNENGEFIWYYHLSGFENDQQSPVNYLNLFFAMDFHVEPEGNNYFLAGYHYLCGEEDDDADTFILDLEINWEDLITSVTIGKEPTVKLFPTIFQNILNISSTIQIDQIKVFDLSGRLVYEQEGIKKNEIQLHIDDNNDMSNQMYLISICHVDGSIKWSKAFKMR